MLIFQIYCFHVGSYCNCMKHTKTLIARGSQKQSRLCQNMLEVTGRLRLICTNVWTFTWHAAHVNRGAAEACSGIRHRRKRHIPFRPTVALSARALWVQQAEGAGDRMASLGLKAIVGESKKCFAEVALGQKWLFTYVFEWNISDRPNLWNYWHFHRNFYMCVEMLYC